VGKVFSQLSLNMFIVLLSFFLLGHAVSAGKIEAEGTSPINGPVGVAKRLALQDAIRQALLQSNAQVSTTTVMSSKGVVSDNVRFTARGNVTNVVVLDEWTDENNYYVRIRAEVPGAVSVSGLSRGRGGDMETRELSRQPARLTAVGDVGQYRRNLAITQFHVLDRTHISDLPNIEVEIARELKRRLSANAQVRTVDASQYLLPLGTDGVVSQQRILGALPPAEEVGQLAIEFASSLGVQFIVSGVIRDMSITKHALGARVRHLELDIIVHDGISGAEIARHRLSESVNDAGMFDFPTSSPVLNEKFYASFFGQRVHRVLDKLVNMLVEDVNNQLFTARVIRTEGKQVYFDAGATANLKVGDVLNTFQLNPSAVIDLPGQRALGFSENPTAVLVVTQVQRLFSVGELDSETVRLSPGDVIRFEP
jgi:Flagellar assembly protein T, middle domain/Flagellar assembly protein T, N-terminal domain